MWNLKDKLALITGGSKGIGKAAVEEFAQLGAQVLFTARHESDIRALEIALGHEGYAVKGLVSDVSKPEDRNALVAFLHQKYGKLDIIVHNAGINIRKLAGEYQEDEYLQILQINLIGPFELSRKLFPLLKKGKNPAVINVASVAAQIDVQSGSPYGMSKAGLLQQTRNLAVEWAKDGIRVNAVSPWYTETPLTEALLQQEERRQRILDRTPLGRVAKAEEMAAVIAFLAMNKASYITGQNIIVDGGMSSSAF